MTFKVGINHIVFPIRTYTSRTSCTRLCNTISYRIFSQNQNQFSSDPICLSHRWRAISCTHGVRRELCHRFWFSWFQPLVDEAMPCHLRGVPAEIRGERALCWPRSGIRWTPLDLAGHHLAKSEKSEQGGWRGLALSLWEHGWPRNLFEQTETCTIPHFKSIQQPEEPKINCKLQWTNDETCQVKFTW